MLVSSPKKDTVLFCVNRFTLSRNVPPVPSGFLEIIVSGNGGNPVKRLGWRTKYSLGENEQILKLYIDSDLLYAITTAGVYRITADTLTLAGLEYSS